MINREIIRSKIVQLTYAYYQNGSKNIDVWKYCRPVLRVRAPLPPRRNSHSTVLPSNWKAIRCSTISLVPRNRPGPTIPSLSPHSSNTSRVASSIRSI